MAALESHLDSRHAGCSSRGDAGAVGEVRKSCFVATALRELSVGLCKGNYLMHRVTLGMLTEVAGWGFCTGADPPVEESSMRMPSVRV
jgi:hypothetical protein